MRILTFDPGFRTGFGFIDPGKTVESGSFEIPGSYVELGRALLGFDERASVVIAQYKPDVIGYAEPFLGRISRPENVGPLFAFVGKINELATARRIECVKFDEPRARSAFLGEFMPARSAQIKKAVIQACRDRGWPACDDHAADALCGAAFLVEHLVGSQAHITTPLFSSQPAKPKGKRNARLVEGRAAGRT